jgi:hypothetical protein
MVMPLHQPPSDIEPPSEAEIADPSLATAESATKSASEPVATDGSTWAAARS